MENFDYSQTMKDVEYFLWHELADHYIEMIKSSIYENKNVESIKYTLYTLGLGVLKLFSPFIPHITEEIYNNFYQKFENDKSIHLSSWPEPVLIEDEKEVAELYKLKLTLDGYEVMIAEGGQEGLDKAFILKPELIFLDIKMPEMDGFEVLKKLRESQKTKDIPVVILSNFDEQDMVEKGLTLGANEYLIKSQFTPEEISKKVKDWVQED